MPHRATRRSTSTGHEAEGKEGKERQGRVTGFGLASLNSSGGLRGTGAAAGCRVAGPGWFRVGDVGLACQGEIRKTADHRQDLSNCSR